LLSNVNAIHRTAISGLIRIGVKDLSGTDKLVSLLQPVSASADKPLQVPKRVSMTEASSVQALHPAAQSNPGSSDRGAHLDGNHSCPMPVKLGRDWGSRRRRSDTL